MQYICTIIYNYEYLWPWTSEKSLLSDCHALPLLTVTTLDSTTSGELLFGRSFYEYCTFMARWKRGKFTVNYKYLVWRDTHRFSTSKPDRSYFSTTSCTNMNALHKAIVCHFPIRMETVMPTKCITVSFLSLFHARENDIRDKP